MIRYALFDLDGTLTESGPGIIRGVQFALRRFGIEERDPVTLKRFIGPPLTESFQIAYGMNDADAKKALYAYREYYNDKGVYENKPYPGVREMLKSVTDAGIHAAIASNKPLDMVNVVLDYFELHSFFERAVCSTEEGPLHTKSGVIAEVLKEFSARDGLDVSEVAAKAVMIGDRTYDITGGKENGLRTIGVSWGYAEEGELERAGADIIVDDTMALTKELLRP